MRVQINENFCIASDRFNFIVEQRKVIKNGENAGDDRWEQIGFYSTMEQACNAVLREKINESEAASVHELITCIKEASQEIADALLERQRVQAGQLSLFGKAVSA